MTLAELETLLNLAKTVAEVFGDNVADSHRDMAAICHPDKWSGTPDADRACVASLLDRPARIDDHWSLL